MLIDVVKEFTDEIRYRSRSRLRYVRLPYYNIFYYRTKSIYIIIGHCEATDRSVTFSQIIAQDELYSVLAVAFKMQRVAEIDTIQIASDGVRGIDTLDIST